MGLVKIPRAVKICSFVTGILILTLFIVILVLCLTIFKPKQPKLTTQEVTLNNINLVPIPFHLNVTLGIVINVYNPNYASYKYDETTAHITYRGTPAAQAPIEADTIPARGNQDISTEVVVIVEDLLFNPSFLGDYASGCLNFMSSTTVHGVAKMLKFLKIKATTYTTCDISVYVVYQNVSSVCRSKVKH